MIPLPRFLLTLTVAAVLGLCPLARAQAPDTEGPQQPTDVEALRRKAQEGDADAQFKLGVMYYEGEGVPKDAAEAVKWFRSAAEQGFPFVQFNLGVMYFKGEGVPKDDAEAVKWFRRAAEQGFAMAQFNLGVSYYKGEGVPKDDAEAVKWFRRAAEQRHDAAQLQLGGMYAKGEGVPKDAAEAVKWFRLAAEQGNDAGQLQLSARFYLGEGVPRNYVFAYSWASLAAASGNATGKAFLDSLSKLMTGEQIAEAQRIAAEFRPKVWKADDAQQSPSASPRVDVTGSGFFITPDGCFVTNHHVVAGAVRVRVRTTAGTFPATVIRTDLTNDIAILQVCGEFPALAVKGSRGIKIADRVATLGFPNPELQGEAGKYSSGEVAALSGPSDDPRFLQVSVPIQPGNSGGPLVDSSGAVVGVVVAQLNKITTFKLTGNIPENVNYAIKGTILLGVLESVPGLAEKVRSEPLKPATDAAEVAKSLEAACGLVLVEK
jgi:TPR repeat protein